ncbi:CapA family protein [Actinocatenispora comari]|uniref:Capsular polysaccharide biosynthesis protein n=1 Tax=Actinocatenispora comari TaxID=2807577 RepID=A0A8J4EJK1_9ACTN|nr:CapA family protein [Actinocatenispora comari]GIL26376.1 capsular polysaccharide biosynthesis protein [Actinocatenispora comari]
MRSALRYLAVAVAVVTLAACSASGDRSSADPRSSRTRTAASPSPTGPPTISIEFAGDVHFTGRTAGLLKDPKTAFGPVAKQLSAADLTIVNLETAVTTRGTPEPKEFHFRAPPAAFDAVKAAGVDVVTVANNHAMDYGRTGLADTLRYAKAAGVPVIGAGANEAAAYRPWITTVHGVRIAFLAFSQVTELAQQWLATPDRSGIAETFDTARAAAAVRAAKRQADVVIVYPHWGQEGNHCPIADQRTFAAAMAKAGATAVVGTHAHLLLGAGWEGDTYVDYGLGNFLWWRDDAFSNDTGVLRLTLTGSKLTGTRFLPAEISRTTGQPIPVTGSTARRITGKVDDLRGCTGLSGTAG